MKTLWIQKLINLFKSRCPKGYREVGKDEILPIGSHVRMDMKSGRNFVKIVKMNLLDIIAQVWCCSFGILAIFLVGSKKYSVRRLGFFSGIISQPAWYFTFIMHAQ